jgi:soluble lytic murein transglycosylase-like protein
VRRRPARARRVVGMGVGAAVWAVIALGPTDLARETPPAPAPGVPQEPPVGPLAEMVRRVEASLAERAPELDPGDRIELAATIVREADEARLDPLLVLAVIEVESRFDVAALSEAGAIGLMQLREPTLRRELRRHGIEGDPLDPILNVRAGVRYLRRLMDSFPGEDVALMAYNAGPNRILGYLRGGVIPERFHVYPRRVKAVLRRLRREPAALEALRTPPPQAVVASAGLAD